MSSEKEIPYWFPVLTNNDWVEHTREVCPLSTSYMNDEEVRAEFAEGRKYCVHWDNINDAYDCYEKLADAYLAVIAEMQKL